MNRRSFTKMLVSLLPAAWVASKVKGEVPKPEPKTLVFPSKSSFPTGFDASKEIGSLSIGFTADIDPETRVLKNIQYVNSRHTPANPA